MVRQAAPREVPITCVSYLSSVAIRPCVGSERNLKCARTLRAPPLRLCFCAAGEARRLARHGARWARRWRGARRSPARGAQPASFLGGSASSGLVRSRSSRAHTNMVSSIGENGRGRDREPAPGATSPPGRSGLGSGWGSPISPSPIHGHRSVCLGGFVFASFVFVVPATVQPRGEGVALASLFKNAPACGRVGRRVSCGGA